MEPWRVLKPEQMEAIDSAACKILSHTGMRIEFDEALGYLRDYGCKFVFSQVFLLK